MAALVVVFAILGALAQAQDAPVDSELTPQPHPSNQWFVLGGARFGKSGEFNKDSITPATVDFFSVAFSRNGTTGFFGGAGCAGSTSFADLDGCERSPAIYRLATDGDGAQRLEPLPLPGGPGYVGAIAWIDDERALAVGGTGAYPRRERPAVAGGDAAYRADDLAHGAGRARAWLYDHGAWSEVSLAGEMGGLTAVACAPDGAETIGTLGPGVCVAGGLQRLWRWHPASQSEGAEGFDSTPIEAAPDEAGKPDFHFRVRQIRFAPKLESQGGVGVYAVAITAGCCAQHDRGDDATGSGPRLIAYDLSLGGNAPSWRSETLRPGEEDVAARVGALPDSYYGIVYSSGSLTASTSPGISVVAAPGGPTTPSAEAGSRILQPTASVRSSNATSVGIDPDAADIKLGSLRLLAGDGDYVGRRGQADDVQNLSSGPDGMLDWAVGADKTTGQGVAYTTVPAVPSLPNPLECQLLTTAILLINQSVCQPAPGNAKLDSRAAVSFPTYTLNALAFVPGSGGALAWAAGDRGALVGLGGAGRLGATAEPELPHLEGGGRSDVGAGGAYDTFRGPTAKPGTVPPLASMPTERFGTPTVVPYGASDPTRWQSLRDESIAAIAMSRQGTEGWAVGSGSPYDDQTSSTGPELTLQHFDGERWSRCDPDGMGGAYDADHACSDVAQLFHRVSGEKLSPPTLTSITRIPLERDDDPTNDDDFAAVAFGSPAAAGTSPGRPTVLNYRKGRWQVDSTSAKAVVVDSHVALSRIAFRTPGDGWLATVPDGGNGNVDLYHYGGGDWPNGQWADCGTDPAPAECGEGVGRLPIQSATSAGAGGRNLMVAVAGDTVFAAGMRTVGQQTYPFVYAKRGDGSWTTEFDPGCVTGSDATCTPGPDASATAGSAYSLAVADVGGGKVAGWLLGWFGRPAADPPDDSARAAIGAGAVLLRRDPETGAWAPRSVDDAVATYAPLMAPVPASDTPTTSLNARVVSSPRPEGGESVYLLPSRSIEGLEPKFPPLAYDAETDRWRVMPTPFLSTPRTERTQQAATGTITAAVGDGDGGLWFAAKQRVWPLLDDLAVVPHPPTFFYRYTTKRHRPVFTETANPATDPITALTGASDGTLWLATASDRLYRYDRLTGWDDVTIKGWDPGKVVTRPSSVLAIAFNDAREGIAVGEQGRIADLGPSSVALDPASLRRCSESPPPCVTPRALRAAAVAPDGSALAGGDGAALVWRPAGGAFRTVGGPQVGLRTTVTGLSLPTPQSAWLTTDAGEIWGGRLVGGLWRWKRESAAAAAADERRTERLPKGRARLNAITVDATGSGVAVGDRGALLERSPTGEWERRNTGYTDNFYSVALPPSGYGDGVLVGGGLGLILTRIDGAFHVARPSDVTDPLTTGPSPLTSGRTVGVAIAGGSHDGEVEAWAASQVLPNPAGGGGRDPAPSALLHYASSDDPLLRPAGRVLPLLDTEPPTADEVTLAAFGRSECQLDQFCPELTGTNMFNDVIARRIRDALLERRERTPGPYAAVFTGDIGSTPGRSQGPGGSAFGGAKNLPTDVNVVQNAWRSLVAEPLADGGVPLFAAIGKTDRSRATICPVANTCEDSQELADAGASLPWRATFASMAAPWGSGVAPAAADIEVLPVDDGSGLETTAPGTGARTHYAFDLERGGLPILRVVVADNTVARSLSASDADQNPVEGNGGQAAWLDRVLCIKDVTCANGGSRPADLPAVLVTNAPTYSYGPGGLDGVQADSAVLETLLIRHRVTAVISGRLGWNGLYYTLASGIHTPCPGGAYPPPPSDATTVPCTGDAAAAPTVHPPGAAASLSSTLQGLGAPQQPTVQAVVDTSGHLTGAIPNLVAASAGGRFGPRGTDGGSARDGYWHGYGVLRIRRSGEVIVEQRPILDWIAIRASTHVLQPGQHLGLQGFGREPAGTDLAPRVDDIASNAVTHRFALVEADPARPYLPKVVADNGEPHGYVPLSPTVGVIDPETGRVTAARSPHGRIYAVAILSVGELATSYPLVFEPRRSFTASSLLSLTTPLVPRIKVLGTGAFSLDAPSAPPPATTPPPVATELPIPTPPTVPPASPLPTSAAVPPVPPAPPPPVTVHHSAPLDLTIGAVGVAVPPTTGVTAQPTPPVNPSPPSGARREAKQRQAATAKSEEGSASGGDNVDPREAQTRVNSVDSPHAYVRQEPYAFTALSRRSAAGDMAVVYGVTLPVLALLLAMGWNARTPRSRRREPRVPAPAWMRNHHWR